MTTTYGVDRSGASSSSGAVPVGVGNLADPGADRLVFWDDSASAFEWLSFDTGLAVSNTVLAITSAARTPLGLATGDSPTFTGVTLTGSLTVGGGSVTTGSATDISLGTGGAEHVRVTHTADANRYLTITGGVDASGTVPTIGVNAGGAIKFNAVDFFLSPTQKIYLDGGSNTYIHEDAADTLDLVAGGVANFRVTATQCTAAAGVSIGAASTNNLIDDASNGAGSTTLYIGNASINVTSDARLKRDVADTAVDASEKLRSLRIVDHYWDDPSDRAPVRRNSRGKWMGLIAQEVVDVAPWAVGAEDPNCPICRAGKTCQWHKSYWRVEREHLVPLAIKGWQDHDTRLAKIEAALAKAGILIN